MWRYTLASLLAFALLMPVSATAIPIARLQLWSEPGDPIGLGRELDVVYDNEVDFAFLSIPAGRVDGVPTSLIVTMAGPFTAKPAAQLTISTEQLGLALQPGTFQNRQSGGVVPGFPFFGILFEGRSPTTLSGQFTIHEVVFGAGTIQEFVADFEQYANGSMSALRGRIEFRVGGVTNIPEPATAILILFGLAALSYRRRSA